MRESIPTRASAVGQSTVDDPLEDSRSSACSQSLPAADPAPSERFRASSVERSETPRREAPGLVHLETSDTWNPRDPEIQRRRRIERMRRGTITGARLLCESLQKGGFRYRTAFITLTYACDDQWQRRHIAGLLKHYRHWLARRGHRLRCVWVAELTSRGRLHYHIVMFLPKGLTPPLPDKQGWWRHGMTQAKWAQNPVAYIAKYASKGHMRWVDEDLKEYQFPKGARIHGRCGLEVSERRTVSWWLLPRYVREVAPNVGQWVVRAKGGGWLCRESGQWWPGWQPERNRPRITLITERLAPVSAGWL